MAAEKKEPKKHPTGLICKFCGVDVVSKTNKRAILGRSHGKNCPRRYL